VLEEAGQVRWLEDGDRAWFPARSLGAFEPGDRVVGEPASAEGVLDHLVQGDERDVGSRWGERSGVGGGPGGDVLDGQVAKFSLTDRASAGYGGRVDVPAHDALVALAG
jgi:hypothetical protein